MPEEPTYRRAGELVSRLADPDENLDVDQAREIGRAVAQFALHAHHPVLLARLLRAVQVPEPVVYESAMAACANDQDRAYLWGELFLPEGARAAITGEDG